MSTPVIFQSLGVERRQPPIPIISVEDDKSALTKNCSILYKNRWLIILITLGGILCSSLYVIASRPLYESNFLIHVEEERKQDLRTIFGEVGKIFDIKTTSDAEIELVKSRLVISQALEKLDIDVSAVPDYFPAAKKWVTGKHWQLPIPPGLGGYAWGNEEINIGSFTVPEGLLNREFTITAQEGGSFSFRDREGGFTASGKVGFPLKIDHPAGPIELLVSELQAGPNVRFLLKRSSKLAMIEAVQANLSATEQGRHSTVIKVTLRGDDPKQVTMVLNEIAKQYVEQNAANKTLEVHNALAFVNKQLPRVRQQLEESEVKYNRYRNSKGTVDLAEETKSDLQQLALAKTRKIEINQKRAELLARFTPNHPAVESLDTQLQEINGEIRKLTDHIKSLPLLEQELVGLSRDMKVNSELYSSLLNTGRQLRLAAASATPSVRLVDTPMMPEGPVPMNLVKVFGIGLLGGLLAGIAAAAVRNSRRKGIENSTEVEQSVNLPVFAVIPYSTTQQKLEASGNARRHRIPLLAKDAPLDKAVESLRNFRAVLQFSAPRLKNNIALIISPTVGNGKSFISSNLAVVLGSGNKRILLIDADLRHGDLHQYFGVEQRFGLAETLAGTENFDKFIHRAVSPNVDFISSGNLPSDPEVLMQPRLEQLLQSFTKQYDLILVNGTPLLEVSDSLAIGSHAGAIYIVARAGISTPTEIAQTIKILHQAGLSAKGCLLNGVKTPARENAYYRQYQYGKNWGTRYLPTNVPTTDVTVKIRNN
jgi:tyrosine-protein kinase Etk/Wzc